MKRITTFTVLMGALAVVMTACSSGSVDSGPGPVSTGTLDPTATSVPASDPAGLSAIPDDAEVDRETAILLGISRHRQLWDMRPSNNYAFGFEWNIGEFAYETANVQVRVIQGEIDQVSWARTAVKTDGSEPVGFVVPDEPNIEDYYSIDGLFKLISDAFDSSPVSVSLAFHSVFGYPTLAIIEFAPGSDREDVSFYATQLAPIAGPPVFGDPNR